jgi:integrase
MPQFNFTHLSIKALRATDKRVDYYDSAFKLRGVNFGIRVSNTGSKEFFVRYRDHLGRQRRMSVGDAEVKSLAAAHGKAKEIAAALDDGRSPAQELADYKLAETVQELCELYLEQHAKFKKDGGKEDRRMIIQDVLPTIGRMKARDVRRRDIIGILDRVAIGRQAKVSANRLRALLSKIFNFALERELVETSPCAGLPRKARENPKERVLSDDEIKSLWNWLDSEGEVNSSIFRLILLTGQRPMEVAKMEWTEVRGSIWQLPKEKTKNAKEHVIPLADLALECLNKCLHIRKSVQVFPGQRGSHVMPRTLQHVSERAIRDLKIQPFTPHDLRRTAATCVRKLGFSRDVVARMLNHTTGGVTAVYDRHDLLPELKEAMHAWSDDIMRIVDLAKPTSNARSIGI